MKITEKCACGSSIDIDGGASTIERIMVPVDKWRAEHTCPKKEDTPKQGDGIHASGHLGSAERTAQRSPGHTQYGFTAS